MIALTLWAHQPWPVSASAFLWLWNMTVDYLACLAMKLLCFVFSSKRGVGAEGWGCVGGWGVWEGLGACEGHRDMIVWRAMREREKRLGGGELGWARRGARERETKSLGDPTNSRDCPGTDGNINHLNCLMNFWWVFHKLQGLFKNEQYNSDYARKRPPLLEQ